MSAFTNETNYYSRKFECGWSLRAEDPVAIAARVQALARRLGDLEPAYGEMWPLLAARAIRPGRDPGPVLEMSAEDLGALIDRRARFDPPRYPHPVGKEGYNLFLSANRNRYDTLCIDMGVSAGVYGDGANRNRADIGLHNESPVSRDPELALRVLYSLVETLGAQWACARAYIQPEGGAGDDSRRPWLAWSAAGLEAPPFPFSDEEAGPPAEVRSERGGDLLIWP
ncbi:hypothetical protein [Phenylobacterium sp.]|uniref:hypothetical protein n=1 Tax=Phenylobacterium sp. TaxID=1871053 RepID=UPI0025DE1C69|nr:hypothetical protein [Phenylobacterium sp.]